MEYVISYLKRDKIAIASLIFLAFIILLSLFAPLLPLEPNKTDVMNMLMPPSSSHWFGTDEVGRDYLARVIYGGRVSLLVGVLAMLASICIGVSVGTIAGYCGGIIDMILMRIVDIMSSIPWMILITVISIFLNPGLQSIIIVIGCFTWMEIARLVRAETLSVKEREYVMYAKFVGTPFWKVILYHIIPSVFPTIIIAATTSIANAIMAESSLSFLGIGIQQPMSSWGSLLQTAQTNLQNALYMAFIPGLLIVCTIFAFNKLGNLLRIYMEPRVTSGEKE
ncbi:MAG: ABC transporter permease [Firmicutes bacterium]|uniref:ABC transporter permease n=1 Tax=Candidatus Scybalomonas excrementavium TaxID=2840943 RepID=A0A9D9N7B6_9FIRM|nr:ABC transporter permease [Candidatus Scybalomonas excrementavium]